MNVIRYSKEVSKEGFKHYEGSLKSFSIVSPLKKLKESSVYLKPLITSNPSITIYTEFFIPLNNLPTGSK